MSRAALVLVALAACAPKPAPQGPAPACATPRHVMTEEELQRATSCTTEDCKTAVIAEYEHALVPIAFLLELSERTAQQSLDELSRIEQEACACKSSECMTTARAALDDWFSRNAQSAGSERQVKDANDALARARACIALPDQGGSP
jgi:hypothetical protein